MNDEAYMRLAIEQAKIAGDKAEVPVGCVIVDERGEVISRGHNLREGLNDPTAHAEMMAIREAAEKASSWRLGGMTLYVTLEPCAMCMGAVVLSRMDRVVFGSLDPKAGAVLSKYSIGADNKLNHRVTVTEGVLSEECSSLLSDFFKALRGLED